MTENDHPLSNLIREFIRSYVYTNQEILDNILQVEGML